MTAALAAMPLPQIAKLVRVLASDRDGEVVAAARAMGRVLQAHGHDLNDLADAIQHGFANDTGRSADAPMPRAPQEMVRELLTRWGDDLDGWERTFCHSIARQYRPLSPKQRAKVVEIFEKVSRRRAS